ncbi:arabinan endo-1,5-alpha-L-arabinosidase [Proteiniphilum sp. UBA1028]|jgi:arabinan endo-1,5-alpha-L-arabinosidase|uniref:arabinan endo-1,5-alpha-L-arabinosidase n=1 Tax=Proteiniphilum sp. UBA1028 TaxID=1947251 RepID=UPI000E993E95|nr:arabinan endo-1,5-alpha-L-arabinosidase [Proteiniphilum sp. UBA1028]HBG58591.1 arabinan endo-1,5-alpha-L-arabinosidase [Porphyromonadaceae bacterium]
MKQRALIFSVLFLFLLFRQQGTAANDPEGRIGVHDPVMIRQDSTYYLFHTGRGIAVWSSTDMKSWKREKPVFADAPQWGVDAVPSFRGHIWAPDISYHNGQYYLYYSVSAFGKNTSCIGLAKNKTLNPDDPAFQWMDHGAVICSTPDKDNWNAIDPNLIIDEEGRPFLFYGSFWDGLQMVRLNNDLTAPYPGEEPVTVASRKQKRSPENPPAIDNNPVDAGGNAIEAPFVVRRGEYYYLFASIDYCCKGAESTYKMIYGRSRKIEGPYLDKEGKELLFGGGTILMEGNERWHGVGHNAIANSCGNDYLLFHAYDANDEGRSKLRIVRLSWTKEQWPQLLEEVY